MHNTAGTIQCSRDPAAHRETRASGNFRQRAGACALPKPSHCARCGVKITARNRGEEIETSRITLQWCNRCTAGNHQLAFGLEKTAT